MQFCFVCMSFSICTADDLSNKLHISKRFSFVRLVFVTVLRCRWLFMTPRKACTRLSEWKPYLTSTFRMSTLVPVLVLSRRSFVSAVTVIKCRYNSHVLVHLLFQCECSGAHLRVAHNVVDLILSAFSFFLLKIRCETADLIGRSYRTVIAP